MKSFRSGSHVAPQHHVDAGDNGHTHHAPFIRQAECHAEQARKAVVDAGGVGNQEHEDDGRRSDAQRLGVVALAEEFRHGGGLQALRYLTRTGAQHPPCQKRADKRIADANPKGSQAILPAELACIAHENYRRKVAGAEGKRRKPWAHVAAAQHEAVNVFGVLARVDAHTYHHADENQDDAYLCNHEVTPLTKWGQSPF